MKGITGYLVLALALAALGLAALGIARYERAMADSQQYIATLDYEDAAAALAAAEGYAAWARWVPGLGGQVDEDMRVRNAVLKYWRQEYDELLPRESDPVGAVDGDSVDLQLVVANAAFRAGQATAADRQATMQMLDEAVGSYMAVLRNASWNEDAAYNYEYLVRLRDEFARSRNQAPPPPQDKNSSNGQAGAPETAADTRKFEIYVPLEQTERTKASEAGKAAPGKRKG